MVVAAKRRKADSEPESNPCSWCGRAFFGLPVDGVYAHPCCADSMGVHGQRRCEACATAQSLGLAQSNIEKGKLAAMRAAAKAEREMADG